MTEVGAPWDRSAIPWRLASPHTTAACAGERQARGHECSLPLPERLRLLRARQVGVDRRREPSGMPTGRDRSARRPPRLPDEASSSLDALADEDDVIGAMVSGDFIGAELSLLTLRECRLSSAAFTGSRLVRATLIDCLITDCDLSGTIWEDCSFERVEFRHCRLSGIQAQGSRFADVAMTDCRIDGGNFRMTVWERCELHDSNLVDSDFYGARLPASRIHGCDLSDVEFSKSDLAGSQLQRSRLDGIRGGDSLRSVTIGSDQIIPAALAIFAAIGVQVDDEE